MYVGVTIPFFPQLPSNLCTHCPSSHSENMLAARTHSKQTEPFSTAYVRMFTEFLKHAVH